MREREQGHVGVARQLGSLERRRVRRLAGPLPLLVEKGGLVDEHVRLARRLEDDRGRGGVARQHELAAGPRRAEHHVRRDHPILVQLDRLAPLEQAALRRLDAEAVGRVDVEAAGPRRLEQRVAERRDAVGWRERGEVVAVPLEHCARLELLELDRVRELAEDAPQRGEQLAEPGRPVDRQADLAAAQRERLQHPRQPEEVVGVVVGEEDLAELDEPDRRAEHLALRALAAVEQEPFAAPPDEHGRGGALRRRDRARRAEEHEIEVHGRKCRLVP
jgi:hypothetical protein